jgi:hypothetical protein
MQFRAQKGVKGSPDIINVVKTKADCGSEDPKAYHKSFIYSKKPQETRQQWNLGGRMEYSTRVLGSRFGYCTNKVSFRFENEKSTS